MPHIFLNYLVIKQQVVLVKVVITSNKTEYISCFPTLCRREKIWKRYMKCRKNGWWFSKWRQRRQWKKRIVKASRKRWSTGVTRRSNRPVGTSIKHWYANTMTRYRGCTAVCPCSALCCPGIGLHGTIDRTRWYRIVRYHGRTLLKCKYVLTFFWVWSFLLSFLVIDINLSNRYWWTSMHIFWGISL